MQQAHNYTRRFLLPIPLSPSVLFAPPHPSHSPTPPVRSPARSRSRKREESLADFRSRPVSHAYASAHTLRRLSFAGGGGGRKEGQGGRVGPGPHASANSRGMWCRPIVVEKRKMGQPANESSRETKESHSHELSPRHLGRVLGCAIGGSTSRPRLFVADVVRLGESFSGPRGIAAWRQRCATHTCTRGPTLRAAEDAAARNLALSDLSRSQQSLSLFVLIFIRCRDPPLWGVGDNRR